MSANPVTDFAERVRKFFYYRAAVCEQLDARTIDLLELPAMPPDDYLPLTGFYSESLMIACAAIDGLSSIWEELPRIPVTHKS